MKVAAYQSPLPGPSVRDAVASIAAVVQRCEFLGVTILCCPEAILGGLADDLPEPAEIAIGEVDLPGVLEPMASATVTTIVGFTERGGDGRLYNSAAVLSGGRIAGIYRKRHPARRSSVYDAGTGSPIFTAGSLRFGILICNDTNHPELAEDLVAHGARALFVPSNNALPHGKADVLEATRAADVHLARQNNVPVARADVAGQDALRTAYGTSAIVGAGGVVLRTGAARIEDLLVAEVDVPAW